MKGRVWIGLAAVLCLVLLTGMFGWTGQPTIPKVGTQYGNDLFSMGGGGCYELVVTGNVSSTTQFACSYMANNVSFPDDYFNTGWVGVIMKGANSTEGLEFGISDFVGSTGTFTTAAIDGNWAIGDRVLIYNLYSNATTLTSGMYGFTVTPTTFSSGAVWNTITGDGEHEIIVVTGTCRIIILAYCSVSIVQGGASTGTIALTIEGPTNIIGPTYGEGIDAGEYWISSDAAQNLGFLTSDTYIDFTVTGTDVGYTLGGAAATAGTLIFSVWWEPISAGATCVAGLGGTL